MKSLVYFWYLAAFAFVALGACAFLYFVYAASETGASPWGGCFCSTCLTTPALLCLLLAWRNNVAVTAERRHQEIVGRKP